MISAHGERGTEVIKTFDSLPDGWKYLNGATTAPNGYRWASNGKSRFSAEYRHALVKMKA